MSDKLKENIELFFSNGVFLPTKTLKLVGDVDEDLFETALCGLHGLDSTHGEITIKLMSDGGSVAIARGIYDLIRGCKNRVRIICYGEVSSSGTLILQAGDERIMSENSKIMLHAGAESIPSDHPRNVDRAFEQNRIDEKWMEDVYLPRIKEKKKRYTRQQLKNMLTWDKSFSPKEALELGLIDSVGEIQ
jgi:ATP-dependent protease ClpP protease subunit